MLPLQADICQVAYHQKTSSPRLRCNRCTPGGRRTGIGSASAKKFIFMCELANRKAMAMAIFAMRWDNQQISQ